MTNVAAVSPRRFTFASFNAINTATALLCMSGRKGDRNIRAAFMHMAADAGISAGVVVAGFAILAAGFYWIDPVVSLAIAAIIIWGTWGLLRDSVNLAPQGIELAKVKESLAALPHVTAVHDLHVWPMSTTETALTAHLVRSVDLCDSSSSNSAARSCTTNSRLSTRRSNSKPKTTAAS